MRELRLSQPAFNSQMIAKEGLMIGSLMMCVSTVVLLVGMLAGIVMGIEQNFTLAPAHAHLNLVGGVLLFLFGLYYRMVPAAGTTTLAKVQGWLHMIGAILCPTGVAVVLLNGDSFIAACRRVGRQRRQHLAMSLFELIHGIVRETDSWRP